MGLHRRLVLVALAALLAAGCASRERVEDRQQARAAAARAVAAEAFPVSLDALRERPGVMVADLPSGKGLAAAPGGAFVRVPGASAVGDLSFEAMLERLRKGGWSLGSTSDTASSCTPGPQALPCLFGNGRDDARISIVALPAGGYELTATAPTGPQPS